MERFFQITITQNWRETILEYKNGINHKEVSKMLPLESKRITNLRFREIEKTGSYYRIAELGKNGKTFIFEIL